MHTEGINGADHIYTHNIERAKRSSTGKDEDVRKRGAYTSNKLNMITTQRRRRNENASFSTKGFIRVQCPTRMLVFDRKRENTDGMLKKGWDENTGRSVGPRSQPARVRLLLPFSRVRGEDTPVYHVNGALTKSRGGGSKQTCPPLGFGVALWLLG